MVLYISYIINIIIIIIRLIDFEQL